MFYCHVKANGLNEEIVSKIEEYSGLYKNSQIYIINSPLGEKYKYKYEDSVLIILSPNHKIIILNLTDNKEDFEEYCEDLLEDLGSISDKFNYKEYIGRPRKWRDEFFATEQAIQDMDIGALFEKNLIDNNAKRKCELLISLLIGSINDIGKIGADVPETLLEKVKKNIILFDGDQTRFIYKNFNKKTISIQGLSGTGKTELLLHKLKEIYISSDDSKIFFTCHNIALANNLKKRIPSFFNFMKVEKQIEWYERLIVDRAWGSESDKYSGLYSYICDFYNIPFLRYSYINDYKKIFKDAFDHISKIPVDRFKFAFDYILIDERQDFPEIFFDLCEKIARNKVYIAGDIFQNIFENAKVDELEVDVILNRCYRTDPRTLMFSHAIGMGLFEIQKYNWLTDEEWKAIGYSISRNAGEISFSREPIRRFEELETDNFQSMIIEKYVNKEQVTAIIKKIIIENPSVAPNDIAIIFLDNGKYVYDLIDEISFEIIDTIGWEINRAFSTKTQIDNAIFITNKNNVKGLEFPFVICVTSKIQNDPGYRNTLYTMLTRSFIQSYLLVKDDTNIEVQANGLEIINKEKCIKIFEPSDKEKEEIIKTAVKLRTEQPISYKEFLKRIFVELKIDPKFRHNLEMALENSEIEKFDKESIVEFININRKFFCK